MHTSRIAAFILMGALGGAAAAQTYVGNLNGTSIQSTFTTGTDGFQGIGPFGWTSVAGAPAAVFGQSANDVLIADAGFGFSNYTVQYDTGTTLVANATYTLEISMGFVSANTGTANYTFRLGTVNGGTFTPLAGATTSGTIDRSTGPTLFGSMGASSANLEPVSFVYTTASSGLPTDFLAVQWMETAISGPSDYFGIDNVRLSYVSAVPEPSAWAAMLGAAALGFAAWRRRTAVVNPLR